MGRASGGSNTPHWIRNNIRDFLNTSCCIIFYCLIFKKHHMLHFTLRYHRVVIVNVPTVCSSVSTRRGRGNRRGVYVGQFSIEWGVHFGQFSMKRGF